MLQLPMSHQYGNKQMELYSHQPSIANILTGIRKGPDDIKLPSENTLLKFKLYEASAEQVLFPSGALTGK